MRTLTLIFTCFLLAAQLPAQTAAKYLFEPDAERVEMRGTVVSTFYAAKKSGKPVFINLDEDFPNNKVTIMVYQEYRGNFPDMKELEGKQVIIKGKLNVRENGKPFIILKHPAQLEIVSSEMP